MIKLNKKQNDIPHSIELDLIREFSKVGVYNNLDPDSIKFIYFIIKKNNHTCDYEKILSVRHEILLNKAFISSFKIDKPRILSMYKDGIDIKDITLETGISPLRICDIVINKFSGNQRDLENKLYAINNDITRTDNLSISKEFESMLYDKLIYLGLKFKTEANLIKEQRELYDKAICTPDFLFDCPITIDNQIIKWIDAKSYYGVYTKFAMMNLKKQAKKYTKTYGNGAFIFKHGYTQNPKFKMKDVILISWDQL